MLGVFKYFNFFAGAIMEALGNDYHAVHILLPLGISFYTFSAISYMLDVSRGTIKANPAIIEVMLYLAFFPKLVSGPIVRAGAFFEQLQRIDGLSVTNFKSGIQIFVVGMFKKMVLADHLGVFVDDVYGAPAAFDSVTIFLAVISYSLQIYFDFSGYSDMAIGVGKILGFDFKKNFNFPYISKNVTEFWKRWHISLSSWLQEYLYYPLGGNRKGRARTYINLMITMVLGGLWHGAAWTFIIWGALHGLALIIHKIFLAWRRNQREERDRNIITDLISTVLTFSFVSFCWIFFRAGSMDIAVAIIRGLYSGQAGIVQVYTWTIVALVLLTVVTMTSWIKQRRAAAYDGLEGKYCMLDLTTISGLATFFVLCGITIGFAYVGNTAFIYGAF